MNFEAIKQQYPDAVRIQATPEQGGEPIDPEQVKWLMYGDEEAKLLFNGMEDQKRTLIFSAQAARQEVHHG